MKNSYSWCDFSSLDLVLTTEMFKLMGMLIN